MKKGIRALLMVLCVFALGGCGNNKNDETAIPDEYIDWFYTTNQVMVDGKMVYSEPTISDYFVIRGVASWDAEGFSWILQNQAIGSDENINDVLFENLEKEDLSQEELDVLELLIFGDSDSSHQTPYKSVFEIDGQLFLDCIDVLDETLDDVTGSEKNAFEYWIAKLEELEANYE